MCERQIFYVHTLHIRAHAHALARDTTLHIMMRTTLETRLSRNVCARVIEPRAKAHDTKRSPVMSKEVQLDNTHNTPTKNRPPPATIPPSLALTIFVDVPDHDARIQGGKIARQIRTNSSAAARDENHLPGNVLQRHNTRRANVVGFLLTYC